MKVRFVVILANSIIPYLYAAYFLYRKDQHALVLCQLILIGCQEYHNPNNCIQAECYLSLIFILLLCFTSSITT
jgi:hypothetical protein